MSTHNDLSPCQYKIKKIKNIWIHVSAKHHHNTEQYVCFIFFFFFHFKDITMIVVILLKRGDFSLQIINSSIRRSGLFYLRLSDIHTYMYMTYMYIFVRYIIHDIHVIKMEIIASND